MRSLHAQSAFRPVLAWLVLIALIPASTRAAQTPAVIDTPLLRFELSPETGAYRLVDKRCDITWSSNPLQPRFGHASLMIAGKRTGVDFARCDLKPQAARSIVAVFHPLPAKPEAAITVTIRATADDSLEFSYNAEETVGLETVRLLDEAMATTAADRGYVLVPVREGLMIPADSGLSFVQSFDTYNYEGCHMAMVGVVKAGAAALLTWTDPYVQPEVRSTVPKEDPARQVLTTSITLRKSAKAFTIKLLGKGDAVTVAQAYRQIAAERGWRIGWDQKLKENPNRAKYFGASNVKLWSLLSRRMNEDSTREESVKVNWSFDEAAQVAEHLKSDLKLDRVLFTLGGWTHRGYDNQHPDVLPAAPECGGDAGLKDCSKRILSLGYLLCLHDNYQDMYKDSPSWDETYLQKSANGKPTMGGKWAGGRAYLTCSQRAVDLAKRPQNLAAVKALTGADSYFIDTTYAVGLQECYDPAHPLTRADDMHWKQVLSDYARGVFGSFGSECGREWAIPHADFFEGLTGVSGHYFHNLKPQQFGAAVVPLFEMVYRDCIAMYGKYGYDCAGAAEYVAYHVSIGRPLNYHSVPSGLYWKQPVVEVTPLAVRPSVADFKQTGPRRFAISYAWSVEQAPKDDWNLFVHFTDAKGQIKFQGNYPAEPTSQWKPGELRHGPVNVTVPPELTGTFDIRIGLYHAGSLSERARIQGPQDQERRVIAGQVKVSGDAVEFIKPLAGGSDMTIGDPGMYTRADGGWAAGMHPVDRFMKNTAEILSPLHELTAQVPMTRYELLTPDRAVRRSTFGEGPDAVVVTVNFGAAPYACQTGAYGCATLPPFGFVIESPALVGFCASSWNGMTYDTPALFVLRSLDGQPIGRSAKVRAFHGFGDRHVRIAAAVREVEREEVIAAAARLMN